MTTTPQTSQNSSTGWRAMQPGFVFLLLGFLSAAASTPFDGFVKGLFQGAALMLLLLASYLIGRVIWPGKDGAGRSRAWLPSQETESAGSRASRSDDA